MQAKDNDILAYLLKHEGLIFSQQDFNSFVMQSLNEGWTTGLRTFLWSNAVQFFFSSLIWDEQRTETEGIIRSIQLHKDDKHRVAF